MLAENRRLMAEFGSHGAKWLSHVEPLIEGTVLDYGAGPGSLSQALIQKGYDVTSYDPCYSVQLPTPRDTVICIAVLEHVEPDHLHNVMGHIRSLTKIKAFITVGLGPSRHTLSDGRNAHVIQEPRHWWEAQLLEHFTVVQRRPWRQFHHRRIRNEAAFLCT